MAMDFLKGAIRETGIVDPAYARQAMFDVFSRVVGTKSAEVRARKKAAAEKSTPSVAKKSGSKKREK